MIKKHMSLFAIAFCAIIFIGTGILIAATPPDNVLIKNEGYKKIKKGPVNFSHKKHADELGINCTECHHKYVNGKNVWKKGDAVEKCAKCHNPIKKKGSKELDLMHAYHKNCMGCHKQMHKAGKISNKDYKHLRKCNTCHGKKSKK